MKPTSTSTSARPRVPWHATMLLLRPRQIQASLDAIRSVGLVQTVPNLWQVELGVLRMLHRLIFRDETVGISETYPERTTWRAKLLRMRPLRAPFLLAHGSITPGDLSGLGSGAERIIRHLLGTFHDGNRFAYDLQLLACWPGKLAELRDQARAVVAGEAPQHEWLRDLCVYDGYHEVLLREVERALEEGITLPPGERDDPDVSLVAWLEWCAAQPETPAATWAAFQAGRFTFDPRHGQRPEQVSFDELLSMGRPELAGVLRNGFPIAPDELDDTEYVGVSLGVPTWVEKLTWKTFEKVFHRDPSSGELRGWNVRLQQGGVHAPPEPQRGPDGEPVTFGHFKVVDAAGYPSPHALRAGLMLDYGQGGNAPRDPLGRLRDPLVAVNEGDVSLLLGWSYLELGRARVPTPSYFVLRRQGPLGHRVSPPATQAA